VSGRLLIIAVVGGIAALAWLLLVPDLGHVHTEEPVIRAQEATAQTLASAEIDFHRRRNHFTAATDSLSWHPYAGMEVVIEVADSAQFRARIMNVGTTKTVELGVGVVDGAPRVMKLVRRNYTPMDRPPYDTGQVHVDGVRTSDP
jgi:hypothetical protein